MPPPPLAWPPKEISEKLKINQLNSEKIKSNLKRNFDHKQTISDEIERYKQARSNAIFIIYLL